MGANVVSDFSVLIPMLLLTSGINVFAVFLPSMRSILRNHRFRRDARTLEDEEEMWFNTDEDDLDDGETVVRTSDKIKTEEDLMEPISKFMERKKCKCLQLNWVLWWSW